MDSQSIANLAYSGMLPLMAVLFALMGMIISVKNSQSVAGMTSNQLRIFDDIKLMLLIIIILSAITLFIGIAYNSGIKYLENAVVGMFVVIIAGIVFSAVIIYRNT